MFRTSGFRSPAFCVLWIPQSIFMSSGYHSLSPCYASGSPTSRPLHSAVHRHVPQILQSVFGTRVPHQDQASGRLLHLHTRRALSPAVILDPAFIFRSSESRSPFCPAPTRPRGSHSPSSGLTSRSSEWPRFTPISSSCRASCCPSSRSSSSGCRPSRPPR